MKFENGLFGIRTDCSDSEDEYIAGSLLKHGTYFFPIKRVLQIRVYCYNEKRYFRTRDVALLLDIKQPFQFTADIRRLLGAGSIVKGYRSEPFRLEEDNSKTTFIEMHDLYRCLSSYYDCGSMLMDKRQEMLNMLKTMIDPD